jgi:hemerythrin-like domain-containing protein
VKLTEELVTEHALIERVVLSLYAFASACEAGTAKPRDGFGYLRFFRVFADGYHHAREEAALFRALVDETGVPADRGPLRVLVGDHRAMAGILAELEALLLREAGPELKSVAERFARSLLHHIDAENSVVFPEAELRFRRTSTVVEGRAPTAEELAARAEGEALATRFEPTVIHGIARGDGCVACSAYGVSCDGIEREWWSELEWEDARARLGSS